ncbi:hypothetical protein [uncultured Prevotella sp.]|uniref:hypothetical protein n=1 Tax=uncultured Prevotella sp. TaxID=159272 RepID=UPI0035B3455F
MIITIYDKSGKARAEISADESSTQQKGVQSDNVLSLSFTHYEHIPLDVNDYVDFEGERYWLTERYVPAQKSEGEWTYDVKLYGIESMIKRFLVLETTDGNAEPVFTLTATAREHVAMVVKCINNGMGHTTDWKVGRVDGKELIVIDYEGKYCDEALKEIAEKVGGGAEWWVEGQTVNVCRCEHGEEIELGYGRGLTSLERDTGNSSKFYTRLFAIGSSRNIDAEKYGHSRLMLPGGRQYVEVHTDEYGVYDHYEKDAFSGIYPRRTGEVSSVRSEDVKGDDGKTFTVYYFKDATLSFDPNEYEIGGEKKRVSFVDGELAGLGESDDHYFEVNFDSKTREFEIITTWPYDDDTQVPGGRLVPKAGDHYILWNVRMPEEYYRKAEEELMAAVEKYNAEHWQDISVYKAPTDHVWVEENNAVLHVGRRVRLVSKKYFADKGYRQSRITKITRKVNLPSQMDIEISDALQTGALEKVNDNIGELKNYTKSRIDGVELPDVIRSWEKTLPTDNNLFSARRSMQEFLSRKTDDTAQGLIRLLQGLKLGYGEKGIDAKGNAVLGDVQMVDAVLRRIVSPGYDGVTQQGFGIVDRGDGKFRLDIHDLQVWGKAVFQELEVRKLSYAGGNVYLSGSGGKIFKTEELTEAGVLKGWRCWLLADDGTTATQNLWRVGDQARCQTFGLADKQKPTRSWWRVVTAVSEENVALTDEVGNELYDGKKFGWIEIAKDNCEPGSDVPMAGDTIVLDGNQNPNERERQGVMILETTGPGTPRIVSYKGVVGYTHDGCEVFKLAPDGSRIVSTSFEWVSPTGDIIHIVNYRGEWQSGVSYGYYDQVNHSNGVWLCTNSNGSTTEPKEGNADWQLVMKAEKGEKGDDGVAYQVMITSDTGMVMINGSGKMTLNATLLCNGEDISDTVGNSSWSWWRQSADVEDDAVWNRLHEGVGRSCLITRDDVSRQAQFGCRVCISDSKTINSK